MRFMLFMMPGPKAEEPGAMPSAEAVARMMKFNEEMNEAGILISLDGLQPTSKGARVSFQNGQPSVQNGPFQGTHLVGGYWLIKANSLQEAVDWARRVPADDGNTIEVRQVFEMEDFPADVQEAAKDTCASLNR